MSQVPRWPIDGVFTRTGTRAVEHQVDESVGIGYRSVSRLAFDVVVVRSEVANDVKRVYCRLHECDGPAGVSWRGVWLGIRVSRTSRER